MEIEVNTALAFIGAAIGLLIVIAGSAVFLQFAGMRADERRHRESMALQRAAIVAGGATSVRWAMPDELPAAPAEHEGPALPAVLGPPSSSVGGALPQSHVYRAQRDPGGAPVSVTRLSAGSEPRAVLPDLVVPLPPAPHRADDRDEDVEDTVVFNGAQTLAGGYQAPREPRA